MRLRPADFWALSLCEWRALITPPQPPSLRRAELSVLMQTYPDTAHG